MGAFARKQINGEMMISSENGSNSQQAAGINQNHCINIAKLRQSKPPYLYGWTGYAGCDFTGKRGARKIRMVRCIPVAATGLSNIILKMEQDSAPHF